MITSPNQIEDNALSRLLGMRLSLDWQLAAALLVFALAVFSRFHMLGERVMSHDESLHTRYSYNLYADGNFTHTPLMHGPALFHATALSFHLFGDSDFSGRVYTAALGVLMVMFPLLLRPWLGKWGALLASLMILLSPLLLYYHRYIRHDTPSIFFGLLMLYCVLQYLDGAPGLRRRPVWLYVFAAAMIMNLASKETAFIYIAVFASFLFLYFVARLAQRRFYLPGKSLFQQLLLGILLGGMMTLGMYIVVDIVPIEIVAGRGSSFAELSDLHRSTFLGWTALTIASGAFVLISTALYAFRDRLGRIPWREVTVIFLIGLLTAGALLFIEELSHLPDLSAAESETGDALVEGVNWLPALALWALAIGISVWLARDRRRAKLAEAEEEKLGAPGLWGYLRQFPEVDLPVLILTLILPWSTALFTRMMGGSSEAFAAIGDALPEWLGGALGGVTGLGGAAGLGQFLVGASVFLPLALLSLSIGISWNRRRWFICAGIFHLLFAFFFTSVFTNIAGLGTGMIYSLGYWLEQQGVRRGSQPQYYYLLVILPTYEFLPVIGSVSAMFAGVTCFWKSRRKSLIQREELSQADADDSAADSQERVISESDRLGRLPFVLLLSWWAILNLVGYSLAGEKMPWLGTHLTLPMILISAWYFGGVFARIDMRQLRRAGWLALLLLPVFVICAAQTSSAFVIGDAPFAGLSLAQLQRTYQWLAGLMIAIGFGALLWRLARQVSWMHLRRLCALTIFSLLCLLTARAAWMASFINYDLPTELLVYAHSAPAVKWALDDITEMSLRTTDGYDIKFAYDDLVSWPYSWYFRNFTNASFVGGNPTMQSLEGALIVVVGDGHRGDVEPILEDRYIRRDYMRMWWPMQEYFNLRPESVLNLLDFSAGNTGAAARRRGIFDIWWARDYDRYGAAAGKDYALTNWPVSDRMSVYIRKDFAAEIWDYGLGDGEVAVDAPAEVNACVANWQPITPLSEFDSSALPMTHPLALRAAGGKVYVADEHANQVHALDARTGAVLRTYGDNDGIAFNRPNSLTILPNGDLLVVDTWNYRIVQVDSQGREVYSWGAAGEFGFNAPTEPLDGFWGPRDVVVDATGRVFVADTGNKRIRVYALEDGEARHQFDIGEGGSAPGELDEPAGLAVAQDGRLFIADTWNRRISVFLTSGIHHADYRVRGWYNTTFNRPYLALDETRDIMYISDPDSKRILVYSMAGLCLGAFGEQGESSASGQFQAIGGVAVDDDGYVYVSDSTAGLVLKFAPFVQG